MELTLGLWTSSLFTNFHNFFFSQVWKVTSEILVGLLAWSNMPDFHNSSSFLKSTSVEVVCHLVLNFYKRQDWIFHDEITKHIESSSERQGTLSGKMTGLESTTRMHLILTQINPSLSFLKVYYSMAHQDAKSNFCIIHNN